MMPNILAIKVAAALALIAAIFAFCYHEGAASVQSRWDSAKLALVVAERDARFARDAENAKIAQKQASDNDAITKAKNDEIDSLRATLARTPRLRVGPAICGGPAAPANPASTTGGNAVDPAGRLVRDDVGRDIDALKLSVEEAMATGRACQAFLRANGMAGAQ